MDTTFEIIVHSVGILLMVVAALFTVAGFVIMTTNKAFGLIEIIYIWVTGKPMMRHFVLFPHKLTDEEVLLLERHFGMYRSLSAYEKKIFAHRVARFIKKKEWIDPVNGAVSRAQKIIISSIGVKLTFGLRRYSLPIVEKIYVFPGPFKNAQTGNMHKGEFHPGARHLAFSWPDLLEGIQNRTDNLHLGLHEFTHALMMELHKGKWADSYFIHQFDKVDKMLKSPANFRRYSHHPYFREYARTNRMEFFAVAVEHFFETPHEFERQMPELFESFELMLNVDPRTFVRF